MNPQRPTGHRAPARSGWARGLLAAALLLAAAPMPVEALDANTPVPDFKLVDVNPNSPRYGRTISPRDYRLQISAYYFGDAG